MDRFTSAIPMLDHDKPAQTWKAGLTPLFRIVYQGFLTGLAAEKL